jgi:hypothetical protein
MNYEEIAREILDCCEGRPGGRLRLETAIAAALASAHAAGRREGLQEAAGILEDTALRLAPEGKRTNQVDQHVASVLLDKAAEFTRRGRQKEQE